MNMHPAVRSCFQIRLTRLWCWFVLGMTGLLVAGCGFKMQGSVPLPFKSLHITIPQNTQFGADVRRAIQAISPDTRLIELSDATTKQVRELAQARLEQLDETRQQRIVELTLKFTFRLVNAKDQVVLPATTLTATRSMPFDERVVQAKEGEAATLFRDMQKSLVTRIVRRITAPDITQRWETLAKATGEEAEKIETVAPVNEPALVPPMWQNPSLTPPPVSINPQ